MSESERTSGLVAGEVWWRDEVHPRLAKLCCVEHARVTLCREGRHFAELRCPMCLMHAWVAAPAWWKADPAELHAPPKRRARARRTALRGKEPICVVCLREGVELEADHISQHAAGGTDAPVNVQLVCHGCHLLLGWRRRDVGSV